MAEWRVFGMQQGGQTIQVAQPMLLRDQLALAAALRTVAPFLLMLPILGVLIWVVVGRGLRPLDAVARAVSTRTPVALDPLPQVHAPSEVLPLLLALNDLLARLKRALDAQREFIADAAHELRTPLAALTLQVQLAERAGDAAARTEAFAEVKGGLQRATHSVQQLLTLARQEPGGGDRPLAPVALSELVAGVIAAHLPLAEARRIDLGAMPTTGEAVVDGEEEALRILISNLVSNAVRYTPHGGKVDVTVKTALTDLSSTSATRVRVFPPKNGNVFSTASIAGRRMTKPAAAWDWPSSGASPSAIGQASCSTKHRLGGLRARVQFQRSVTP
jgi:two-component system OmpR family sensor kinase